MATHGGPEIRRARSPLAALIAGLIMLSCTPGARATYIGGLIGNTRPGGGNANYTINFAVLNPFMGNPNDTWAADRTGMLNVNGAFRPGQGSPALDTNAQYLYLYQVVNNSPMNGPTLKFQLLSLPFDTNSGAITSWGAFLGLGFSDDNGVVNTTNSFGLDNVPFDNPAVINIGVTNPSVAMIGGLGIPPSTDVVRITATMGRFDATWGLTHLAPGEISSVYGFTTNLPPTVFTPRNTGVGGTDNAMPVGWVASPVPAPGALALLAIGSALATPLVPRRRRSGRDRKSWR